MATPHRTTPGTRARAARGGRSGRPAASARAGVRRVSCVANAAGANVVGELVQRRPHVDPATMIGGGKVGELSALGRRTRRDDRVRIQRPRAAPTHEPREGDRFDDRRPDRADPRHLRAARAQPRRQTASRTGAIALPAVELDRRRVGALAPRGRHRHPRPRRNEARGRPPQDPAPHHDAAPRARNSPRAARDAPPARRGASRWSRSSGTRTSASHRS